MVHLDILRAFLLIAVILHNNVASSTSPPVKIGKGYRLLSLEETSDGGLLGLLGVNQKNNVYGSDIPNLKFFVKHETSDRLRIHITDAEKARWEVPYNLLPREQPPLLKKGWSNSNKPVVTMDYEGSELILSLKTDPFGFAVRRKSNGETLFNTSASESDPFGELVFKDQYLEISTRLPREASLYGLGENTQPHGIKLFPGDPYTLYTADKSAVLLNTDLYGSHPVYMDLRNQAGPPAAHAVLLLNSNGMDVFYRGNSLTYKVIGGVLDFYFFAGPSPLAVVDQYTQLIGRPAPMPYWAFGFHQCRWGYRNLSMVENVVENYRKAEIPLDVIWNDDDHMDWHKDFTLNQISFPRPKLMEFLDKIHSIGMKYIVIIDPGIAINATYGVYTRGMAKDVFIKYHGKPFVAQVWPGAVHFPDFLNPVTVEWWGDEIQRFHDLVPADGLWIDMNEISNFCTGLCRVPENRDCPTGSGPAWVCCLDCQTIADTRWDDPPYKINGSGAAVPIGDRTIATSAYHYNGVLEYDAHSLYGFTEAIATHKALLGLEGKRPFVLSRSTYVGSGKYTAHWTGDNKASWDDLKYSISTILNFGIFGVPMVGADICGFYPSTNEELCNRWIELGAFYPFSRDHANFYSPSQELYVWESVAASARNALGLRYKLLPYLYTLNYEAHTKGAPIARPLFFSFPTFTECYDLSTQFLLGSSVMVSPVLEKGATTVTALFPPGSWYSLTDMSQVITSKEGRKVTLAAPLNVVNVHLYQNTILPMQKGGVVSKEARKTPFTIVVAFPYGCTDGEAKGTLYIDDDELPEMALGTGSSSFIEFHATLTQRSVKLSSQVQDGEYAMKQGLIIDRVILLGVGFNGTPSDVELDGSQIVNHGTSNVGMTTVQQQYAESGVDGDEKVGSVLVELMGLNIPVGKNFVMSFKMN